MDWANVGVVVGLAPFLLAAHLGASTIPYPAEADQKGLVAEASQVEHDWAENLASARLDVASHAVHRSDRGSWWVQAPGHRFPGATQSDSPADAFTESSGGASDPGNDGEGPLSTNSAGPGSTSASASWPSNYSDWSGGTWWGSAGAGGQGGWPTNSAQKSNTSSFEGFHTWHHDSSLNANGVPANFDPLDPVPEPVYTATMLIALFATAVAARRRI